MECPLCPKQYQSKKDLNRHLKKYHNTNLKDAMNVIIKPTVGDSLIKLWDNKEDECWNDVKPCKKASKDYLIDDKFVLVSFDELPEGLKRAIPTLEGAYVYFCTKKCKKPYNKE